MAQTNGKLIIKKPGYCGGAARVRSISLPVSAIISMHDQGSDLEEIADAYKPNLPLEEIKAAIVYYNEHKEEIDREIYAASKPPKGYRVGSNDILVKV